MAKKRKSRWASEAAMQALVRFGPELSGLKTLQREAESQYKSAVRSAHGTSAGIINAVDAARPDVANIYSKAGTQASQAYGVTAADMQGLGPVANSIRAAASLEQQGLNARLAESRASSLNALASRRVQAKQGEQFAVQSAHDKLVSDLTKVLERKQDLAGERGAFQALTQGQLEDAARQRALQVSMNKAKLSQSERNSIRSSGIDPDTGKRLPNHSKGSGSGSGGGGWVSQEKQLAAADTIDQAKRWARDLKSAGLDRHEVAAALLAGREAKEIPLHDPSTGRPVINPDGTPKTKKIAGLPKIDSELYLSVALDAAYDGHISARNQKLLHARGIKVGPLGIQTRGQFAQQERKRRKVQSGPVGQAGVVASILAQALGVR